MSGANRKKSRMSGANRKKSRMSNLVTLRSPR
jgi:hypothetical protein